MKKLYRNTISLIIVLVFTLEPLLLEVSADPVNINQFKVIPVEAADSVIIAADGSSVTIPENSDFISVILSNDPGSGDPRIIVAGEGVIIQFEYEFTEGDGEDDVFEAFIIGSNGPIAGENTEFLIDDTNSGTVVFDVSTSIGEPFIGLQFQLSSRFVSDSGTSSSVTISNLQINLTNVITTLNPGWNLFSIPVIPQPSSEIEVVFGNQGQAGLIRATTIWEWSGQQFNIAENIEPGNGYWVHIDGDVAVDVQNFGTLPSGDPQTSNKGWNLVGIKDILSIQVPTNTEIRGKVFGWDAANQSLFSVDDSSLPGNLQQILLPGRAYWMYLAEEAELMLANPP